MKDKSPDDITRIANAAADNRDLPLGFKPKREKKAAVESLRVETPNGMKGRVIGIDKSSDPWIATVRFANGVQEPIAIRWGKPDGE